MGFNAKNIFKLIGRIVAIFFLSIIVLVSLQSFSVNNFFALILASMGIFISLPIFNHFTQKYLKYKLPTWIKIIILIIIFFVAISIIGGNSDKEMTSLGETVPKEEKINLEDVSATKVLDEYLNDFSYTNFQEMLNKNQKRQFLSSGSILENQKLDYYFLSESHKISMELQASCFEAEKYNYHGCKNMVDTSLFGNGWNNFVTVLSKEILEQNETITKIKVKTKQENTKNNNNTQFESETVYILKKEGALWKINDYIDEDGKLFSKNIDLNQKKKNAESLQEWRVYLDNIKDVTKNLKYAYDLSGKLKGKVIGTLPDAKIINFNLGSYNNQTNKFVIEITYYFKEQWLVDNYLGFEGDATKIYKAIYTYNEDIMQVQITAKQKYNDNYGNEQEKFLGRSLMKKSTSDKINWDNFESSKLDQITQVTYYGNSMYKDLKDLQNQLESWQDTAAYSYGTIAPVKACDIVKNNCQNQGDCEGYELLKSQGMC